MPPVPGAGRGRVAGDGLPRAASDLIRRRPRFFHADDPGHMLYVIVSGQVRIEKISPSGETIHLADRGRNDHFGELALLDGKPRMASATTVSECLCLTMEREAFQQCLRSSPAMAFHIMATLAERLREAADALESAQELDVLGRLCKGLLELTPDDSLGSPVKRTRADHASGAWRTASAQHGRASTPRPVRPPQDRPHSDQRQPLNPA